MHLESQLLRAIARLSRQGRPARLPDLELRIAAEPDAIHAALERLTAGAYVTRHGGDELRLTLSGLAVAVATAASVARRVKARAEARGSVEPTEPVRHDRRKGDRPAPRARKLRAA